MMRNVFLFHGAKFSNMEGLSKYKTGKGNVKISEVVDDILQLQKSLDQQKLLFWVCGY